MSTDNANTVPAPEGAPPETPPPAEGPTTTETTEAARARAKRTTWPISILRVENGGYVPLKDSPEFGEAREAYSWIAANGKPTETYLPARLPAKSVKQTLALEEVPR